MATVDFNSAIYYTISDGKICRQHKQPVEGSIERITKTGKTVYEKFFKALKGRIVKIDTKEGEYGKFWVVTLQDDSGVNEVLQFQYSSGYANGFLKALPNVDLGSDVVIAPNMQVDGDKKKTTIFLTQHGTPVKWFYTKDNPNGLPALQKVKVKGKETWDDSDAMEFLENMVNTQIKPKLRGAASVPANTPVAAGADEPEDDLPF
jgi:hypothetical protein